MDRDSSFLQDLMLLSRSADLVLRQLVLKDVSDGEMSLSRMSILQLLGRRKVQNVNDFARFLGQTKAAASQNVERLVQAGLVARREDPHDRRCTSVTLTTSGKRFLARLEAQQNESVQRALERVPSGDIEALSGAMRRLSFSLLEQLRHESDACLHCCAFNAAGCVHDGSEWKCVYMADTVPSASAQAPARETTGRER